MRRILVVFIAPFVLYGCTPEPTACFTTSATSIMEGETITFTDCSEDADYLDWEFGDLGESRESNPTHTYQLAGKFEAIQIATNNKGRDETSVTIEVGRHILHEVEMISYSDTFSQDDAACYRVYFYLNDILRGASENDCSLGVIYGTTEKVETQPNIKFAIEYVDFNGSVFLNKKDLVTTTTFDLDQQMDYPNVVLKADGIEVIMSLDFELYIPEV